MNLKSLYTMVTKGTARTVQIPSGKMRITQRISVLALLMVLIGGNHRLSAASVEGELKVWYPVTITFTGKEASETEATFRDHRLDVTFSKGDKSFRVPGYFAADGNAAESSATNGNKWRVKFTPNEPGAWTYSASFREGPEIAVPAGYFPRQQAFQGGEGLPHVQSIYHAA